ncbi:MAG TPA: flagellar biosynthetic protein FliR [Candidatus Xenobia bacterium]|jgi:flagellar biosynthetic protein FliR
MPAEYFVQWATFLLVLDRVAGFFVQAAIWGNRVIPHQVLVGIALGFSILIYPNVTPPELFHHFTTKSGHPLDLAFLGILLFQQFAVGLVLGFISYITFAIVQFAGELFDIQMGLSAAASADPSGHGSLTMLDRMTFYLAMIIYLLTDTHVLTMRVVQKSFEVIPVDCFNLPRPLLDILWMRSGEMFKLGLELAAPVVSTIFIVQVALGMVARVAPQMNVFMLSFPMNIGIGMTILCNSWTFIEAKFLGHDGLFYRDIVSMSKAILYMAPHHIGR